MKVKKLFGGLLLAATIMMASSCAEILQQMSKTPTFYIPELMYNGQTFLITRVSACKYEFSTDSKYLTIKENADGKFIATVSGAWTYETSEDYLQVKVTAINPDDSSVDPVESTTYIHDWTLKLFKGETEVKPTELKLGSVYTLKMCDSMTGIPVPTLLGAINYKNNVQKLEWKFKSDELEMLSSTATTMELKATKTALSTISASLGTYVANITLYAK